MAAIQTNARYGNIQQVGNNVAFFQKMKEIIRANDGKRSPKNKVMFAHDQQAPFNMTTKTQIDIVDTSMDVSNIRKSFITATIRVWLRIANLNPAMQAGDVDRIAKLFVGWKYSGQAIRRMQLYSRSQMITYQQEHMVQEAVAFSAIRPQTARDRKRFVHTLYDNAVAYLPDICGTYVNLADFADGVAKEVKFDINIPVVDMLALQCFSKWMKEFGALMLELYFTPESMVVCTCNPQDVLDNKIYLQSDNITNGTLAGDYTKYEHRFTQMGDQFTTITNVASGTGPTAGTATFSVGFAVPSITQAVVQELTCSVRGYMLKESAIQQICALCKDGLVIPAEYLDWHDFPSTPNDQGIQTAINIPYENVVEGILVFPTGNGEYRTCYPNPMLNELSVTIGSLKIPEQPYSTIGARFLQEQLIINDLDGNLASTAEFTNSIVNPKNRDSDGHRYPNSVGDDSSFFATLQLERGDSDYARDGLTLQGNVSTLLRGSSLYTGTNNTYYYPFVDASGNVLISMPNTRHPELWQICDKYFIAFPDNKTLLKWEPNGDPPGSQVA